MLTRPFFAHRLFSLGGTIQWVDSAYLPSNLTDVVRPPMGNGAAAFGSGAGHTIGQSYDDGEHPPR